MRSSAGVPTISRGENQQQARQQRTAPSCAGRSQPRAAPRSWPTQEQHASPSPSGRPSSAPPCSQHGNSWPRARLDLQLSLSETSRAPAYLPVKAQLVGPAEEAEPRSQQERTSLGSPGKAWRPCSALSMISSFLRGIDDTFDTHVSRRSRCENMRTAPRPRSGRLGPMSERESGPRAWQIGCAC